MRCVPEAVRLRQTRRSPLCLNCKLPLADSLSGRSTCPVGAKPAISTTGAMAGRTSQCEPLAEVIMAKIEVGSEAEPSGPCGRGVVRKGNRGDAGGTYELRQ